MTILLTTIWKTSSYIADFVAEQEHYIRMKNFETGLQQYVIAFIKQNFDTLIERQNNEKKTLQIQLVWPPSLKNSSYNTLFELDAHDSLIKGKIRYFPNSAFTSNLILSIERLTDSDDSYFKINEWSYS